MAKEEELFLLTSRILGERGGPEVDSEICAAGPKARDLKLRHCFLGRDT